jgi:hypothetical protein
MGTPFVSEVSACGVEARFGVVHGLTPAWYCRP